MECVEITGVLWAPAQRNDFDNTRNERTLLGVGSSALLGSVLAGQTLNMSHVRPPLRYPHAFQKGIPQSRPLVFRLCRVCAIPSLLFLFECVASPSILGAPLPN